MTALFDPARHEALAGAPWREAGARRAIETIAARACRDFKPGHGWPRHPREESDMAESANHSLYDGSAGAIRALDMLAGQGAIPPWRGADDLIGGLADAQVQALQHAQAPHGTDSFLLGSAGLLLLAWDHAPSAAVADRLEAVVRANLHNPVREALWGNSGSVLAAIGMAERTGEPRWTALVRESVQLEWDSMQPLPEAGGAFGWQQDLYGNTGVLVGAGHGFVSNVYAAVRGAAWLASDLLAGFSSRTLAFLQATALHDGDLVNWWSRAPAEPTPERPPLVQDCHGAPGIVVRLARLPRTLPETPAWDDLLRRAGELTWAAGPINKGVAFCHGSAGSAHAFLMLAERFGEERWLDRAHAFAMHGIVQAERDLARHGQGRHTLWTGDLGLACVLQACIDGRPSFPTLEML